MFIMAKKPPPRSVHHLIYDESLTSLEEEDEDEEDDDGQRDQMSSIISEQDTFVLPIIEDDADEPCEWCGICPCTCRCRKCRLKQRKTCQWGWVRRVVYYVLLNVFLLLMFSFVLYWSKVQYQQHPMEPSFKQIQFRKVPEPGLAIVPGEVDISAYQQPFIYYNTEGRETDSNKREQRYADYITEILYNQTKSCKKTINCPFLSANLGPCEESPYGYTDLKPCLYLKLNRLLTWDPEEYSKKEYVPKDLPDELKDKIEVSEARLWVNCKGATPYDDTTFEKLNYYPGQFFHANWFPMSAHVQSNPIVAVQVLGLERGIVTQIVCGLYARNIHNHKAARIFVYIIPKLA